MDKREAEPFLEPVDHEGLGLTDYMQIIKRKMDLGTVQDNLQEGEYQTVEECLADVQLVWDNCKLYNVENSGIYRTAVRLEKQAQRAIQDLFGTSLDYSTANAVPPAKHERSLDQSSGGGGEELANKPFLRRETEVQQ